MSLADDSGPWRPEDSLAFEDPLLYSTGHPHSRWRRLRERHPVRFVPSPGTAGYWSVARHADVVRVLRDAQSFSSDHSTMLDVRERDAAAGRAINLVDGQPHRALRTPTFAAMSATVARDHAATLQERVDRLVAESLGHGPIDFAQAISMLPMLAVGELLGIPPRHWPAALRWTVASVAPQDPQFAVGPATATLFRAHLELMAILTELSADPVGGLAAVLRTVDVDDRPIQDADVLVNLYAFLMGATITVPQVVSHLVLLATGDAALWGRLREQVAGRPESLAAIVEEATRWVCPVNHVLRRAVVDVELGGQLIRAGELVCCWLASANRDEEAFASADSFVLDRTPNPHVGFGSGPHYCAGVWLARQSLTAALAALLQRVERVELAGPVSHLHSTFVNGLTQLPVLAHPAR